ncbi:MAG: outer membrane lipoprotein carrier protein LolA [Alicyclobacillus sp.]|nr:outer membrane lipoprotein carrier protein LolA [Alicyclobacillus sp.]
MRKVHVWVLALGVTASVLAGCGTSTKQAMTQVQTQQQRLDQSNYQSTATMTVQMDNGAQTYYIATDYESPQVYKIALGDSNKNINQVIVRNEHGMFVVSPTLQKVFRFNGNWAQNQGHIYLYDQILQQILTSSDVKVSKKGDQYTFVMPVTPANDIVTRQQVDLAASTLEPRQVILFDNQNKAVVTIRFTSFKTGVKYQPSDFDPQKIAQSGASAKPTLASSQEFGYVEPQVTLGDKLNLLHQMSATDAVLRYTGNRSFTLEEWRPDPGTAGLPNGQLVDLFGVPAVLAGDGSARQLTWLNNGVEFQLTSAQLNLDEMKSVALSTLGQVGK